MVIAEETSATDNNADIDLQCAEKVTDSDVEEPNCDDSEESHKNKKVFKNLPTIFYIVINIQHM